MKNFLLNLFLSLAILTKTFAAVPMSTVATSKSTLTAAVETKFENKINAIENKSIVTPDGKITFADKMKHKMYASKFFKKLLPEEQENFYFGSFALGFLLGLLGVLIVYLVNKDKDVIKKKMRAAWIGWICIVGITLIYYNSPISKTP